MKKRTSPPPLPPSQVGPRLFSLVRDRDPSGVSGTGEVAQGVRWPSGKVTVCWLGTTTGVVSITGYDRLEDVETVHGHHGATTISWAEAATWPDQHDAPPRRHLESVTAGGQR